MRRGQFTVDIQVKCCALCPYGHYTPEGHQCSHDARGSKTHFVDQKDLIGFPDDCPEMQ